MISIINNSFDYKCTVETTLQYIKIKCRRVLNRSLILALIIFNAITWGISLILINNDDNSFGIITTVMLLVFIAAILILDQKTITINPETRMIFITGWSEREKLDWASENQLSYERMFDDNDNLSGIRLYISNMIHKEENTIVVFESEDSFHEFAKLYNQKYPTYTIKTS